jgi:hypothetical protein
MGHIGQSARIAPGLCSSRIVTQRRKEHNCDRRRRAFYAKQGSAPQVVELLKGEMEGNTGYTKPYRVYTQNIGPYAEVVVEWQYDNLQEIEPAWDIWRVSTDIAEFWTNRIDNFRVPADKDPAHYGRSDMECFHVAAPTMKGKDRESDSLSLDRPL